MGLKLDGIEIVKRANRRRRRQRIFDRAMLTVLGGTLGILALIQILIYIGIHYY